MSVERQEEDPPQRHDEMRQPRTNERPAQEREDPAGLPSGVSRQPADGDDDSNEGPLTDPTAEPGKPV